MIKLEELKPILEELIDDREDAAEIIERVSALDVEDDRIEKAELDKLNESWNERFKKAFFGEKADQIDEEIPEVEEIKEEVSEDYDGEDLTYDKLFTEVEKKEEEE